MQIDGFHRCDDGSIDYFFYRRAAAAERRAAMRHVASVLAGLVRRLLRGAQPGITAGGRLASQATG